MGSPWSHNLQFGNHYPMLSQCRLGNTHATKRSFPWKELVLMYSFPSSREKQVLQMWVLLKVQWEKVKSIPYPFALHKHPHYYLPLKGQACRTNLYVLYYRTYGLTQSDGRPDFVLCCTTDTLMVHWCLLILWQEVQSMSPFKTFRRHLLHFLSFPPNNMHEEAGRGLCQIELLNLRVRRVPPQARDLNHFQS